MIDNTSSPSNLLQSVPLTARQVIYSIAAVAPVVFGACAVAGFSPQWLVTFENVWIYVTSAFGVLAVSNTVGASD